MKHLYLLVFAGLSTYSFGQQSVNTSGGVVQSSQGSVSFSIGQVSTNYLGSGANLNEGVQQPYEFFTVLSVEKHDELMAFEAFPNPTEGIIYLKGNGSFSGSIGIYDESGRLVWNDQWNNAATQSIDLTHYARGVYSIKITESSSFQIIKIIKN